MADEPNNKYCILVTPLLFFEACLLRNPLEYPHEPYTA